MCIRDRSEPAARRHDVRRRHAGVPDGGEGSGAVLPGFFGPVSYTHLRAHETVLDLVCRLLLEKKNKRMNIFYMGLVVIV